jgi:hypothetical protein
MDDGVWTLKCQGCGETFEIELTSSQRVVEYARDHPCPACRKTPSDMVGKPALTVWHKVVGFRVLTKLQKQ